MAEISKQAVFRVGVINATLNDDLTYTLGANTYYTVAYYVGHLLNKSIFIEIYEKAAGDIDLQLQYSHDGETYFDIDGDSPVTITANGYYVYTSNSVTYQISALTDYSPYMRLKITSAPESAKIKIRFCGINK